MTEDFRICRLMGREMSEQVDMAHAFWLLAQFDVHRYLMSNTAGRLDGFEKAKRHENLCVKFLALKRGMEVDDVRRCMESDADYQRVHNETQSLTSYLDQEIGFPVNDRRPDYDRFALLFAAKFLKLAHQATHSEGRPL